MTVRRTRPRPKRSVSIPSLIAGVVADVLVGLMLVLIMLVDQYSPTFGEGSFSSPFRCLVQPLRSKGRPVFAIQAIAGSARRSISAVSSSLASLALKVRASARGGNTFVSFAA